MKQNPIQNIIPYSEGRNIFVIGGGPSVNDILPDKSILNNELVIATNNAYKLYPDALICHFADRVWYGWHKDCIHKEFNGIITTATTNKNTDFYRSGKFYTFTKVMCKNKIGVSFDLNKVAGNNAGHHAINIAIHLKARNIVLIGFDMDSKNPKGTHWHNDHKRITNTSQYTHTMIPDMKKIPVDIKDIPCKIWNMNPKSAIKCFDFANSIEEFL